MGNARVRYLSYSHGQTAQLCSTASMETHDDSIFVGNRVSDILDCVPSSRWNHIAGVENPADCASRGIQGKGSAAPD